MGSNTSTITFVYAKGNIQDGCIVRPATFTYDNCTLGEEHEKNTEDGFVLFKLHPYAPAEANPQDIGRWCEVSRELTEAIRQACCRQGINQP